MRSKCFQIARASLRVAVLLSVAACAPPPAWELPSPPPTDSPIVSADRLTRSELDNGLHLLILEDHRLPRVMLSLTTRRGAAIESLDSAGLATFTAAVMERGAGDRDALALAEAVDELGASLSVSAEWDSLDVSVSGLSRDLDALMEILADVALRPRFEAEEAQKTRDETLAQLERAKDSPATLASWYTSRALFPEHRYGIPVSGTPETVANLDAAGARDFHARVFVPNNSIFAVAGDVDASNIRERAESAFGPLVRGELGDAGSPTPAQTPAQRIVHIVDRPELAQARISVAHEGIARTDPNRIPAAIVNSVLGGSGFSSRLMARVRADAGLTYGVGSGFALRRERSLFRISTFTRVAEVRTVIDLLLSELARMRSEPPTASELKDAQMLAAGGFALSLETSDAVISGLVGLDIYDLPPDSLDTYRGRVRAVTVEDTAREANRLLHPERVAIILVGPAEALRPLVEDLGPVEIFTP